MKRRNERCKWKVHCRVYNKALIYFQFISCVDLRLLNLLVVDELTTNR